MICGGPDERGVGAVRIVAVSAAPGVDEVRVGVGGATDHRRFWLEVTFSRWWSIVLVGAEEVGEENYASVGVTIWVVARGWIGHGVCCGGIRIVVGEIAVARGFEGGDFGLGGRGGAVTPNGTGSTESEACKNADDGDHSEDFDEGKRCHGAERDEGVKGRRRVENCEFLILDFGFKS